ncbi:unnamed protein product [Sphagnum compactum]
MDTKDSKGLGKGESEDPVRSHVVHTSGAVLHSPGQNQKVKPESCNISSSIRSSSQLDEDIPSELLDERIPSVVAPLYSGKAPLDWASATEGPKSCGCGDRTSNSRLCPVIGVSVDKTGKVLVVMQLMDGDLRTLIDKRIDELYVCQNQIKIVRANASGIRELHACGRIHKGIKASNVDSNAG